MVNDQRGHLQVLSKHDDRRTLALGVSLSLLSVGCRSVPKQTAALDTAPAASAVVMLQEEVRLAFYNSSAQRVSTFELGAISPEFVACFGDKVVLQQGRSVGLVAADLAHTVVWSDLPAADAKCERPTLNIVSVRPAQAGGMCVTLADGPPGTASCTQIYTLQGAHGTLVQGCQIASFDREPTLQVSSSGRYSVTLGGVSSGDSDYFRRIVVADHQTAAVLTLEQLMIEHTQADVAWLPNDAGAVVGGIFITLPALKVAAKGLYGCVLLSSNTTDP